jgi:hypothetical protein
MSTEEVAPSPGSASGVEEPANVQKLHMNAFGVIELVAGAAAAVAPLAAMFFLRSIPT